MATETQTTAWAVGQGTVRDGEKTTNVVAVYLKTEAVGLSPADARVFAAALTTLADNVEAGKNG